MARSTPTKNPPFMAAIKSAIAKILPDNARLDVIHNLPKIETWRKKFVSKNCPMLPEHTDLYRHIQTHVIQDRPIDYLEFGVFKGESIAAWTEINRHEQSRFFGFDTFTGLPEDWKKFNVMTKGTFDCGGETPKFDDSRVEFVK